MHDIIRNKLLKYGSRFRKRQCQVYCIGAAKTGTTSIAQCLSSVYRSAHEPETLQTNRLIIDKLEGKITNKVIKKQLIKRDNRLRLEVEASHPLSYLSKELVEIFPKAKFIVTIREPYAWLASRLNFHYKKNPPEWEEYRKYFWIDKNTAYHDEEKPLIDYDLCTLDTYLKQYSEQYELIFKFIPKEKMLVIKTNNLNNSIKEIEKYINIPPNSLKMPTTNKEPSKIIVLNQINNEFILKKIWDNCNGIIKSHFPETINNYK